MDSLLKRIEENLREISSELEEKISREFEVMSNEKERAIRRFYAYVMKVLNSPLRREALSQVLQMGFREMGNFKMVWLYVSDYLSDKLHLPLGLVHEVVSRGLEGTGDWGYITRGKNVWIVKKKGVYKGDYNSIRDISLWIIERLEERLTN